MNLPGCSDGRIVIPGSYRISEPACTSMAIVGDSGNRVTRAFPDMEDSAARVLDIFNLRVKTEDQR